MAAIAALLILLPAVGVSGSFALEVDRLSGSIAAIIEREAIPGAAVAIVRDGRPLLVRGFGTDGYGRPVSGRTGFKLGSMSKAFTALAVMRLVDRGRLILDEPVRQALPEFRLADAVASDQITLRHLLTHTSGIPARAPRATAGASLADHVAALAGVRPLAAPGARHVYSSPNYLVAARAAEVAADRPFADLLAAEVLRPLRLSDGRGASDPDGGIRHARGHRYWGVWPVATDRPDEPGRLATAGLVLSAEDMASFLLFQLGDGTWQGTRILTTASMAEMHRGQAAGEGFDYGFGWREGHLAGIRAVHHGGILPDFRGKMVLLPDHDIGVAVLTNASSALPLPAQPTSHRLADAIAAHLVGEPFQAPSPSERMVRAGVWLGLGLFLAGQIATLVRVIRGRDGARRPRLSAVLDIGWIVAVAIGLPIAIGLEWTAIAIEVPDGILWLVVMATVGMASAVLRLLRPSRLS